MEDMELCGSPAGGSKDVQQVSSTLDLESYATNYCGHTKIQRLLFITKKSKDLSMDAYRLALQEIKKTSNTTLYQDVVAACQESFGASEQWLPDTQWIETVDKRALQEQEKLEMELKNYKTNLIKESIRMGHNDLGDFYYDRGDLQAALKCFVRTRDYCTTSKHIIAMCLNVIKVSIEMTNYIHVGNYVQKAEHTPDIQDPVVIAKLKCASGLVHLEHKRYKLAARKFLETTIDLSTNFSEVIAPQDVAVYGGLCALATFDREELKSKVIDSSNFRNFLELTPEVRELINDFYGSRYAQCLGYLAKMKNDLLLDIHLNDHIDALYEMIRSKALIQYFSPFLSVDMNTMAEAFNTTVQGLEKEIAKLIMASQIQGRIDSHNKVLHACNADQRSLTFHKALAMGDSYLRDARALLLRINLTRHDFLVRGPPREGGGVGRSQHMHDPSRAGGMRGEQLQYN